LSPPPRQPVGRLVRPDSLHIDESPRLALVPVIGPCGVRLVAPREELHIHSTPGGILPLGLRREALAGPFGVGLGIVPGDVDNGMGESFLRSGQNLPGTCPAKDPTY